MSVVDATDALWHDPTGYDPLRHGPPYLPDRKDKLAMDKNVVRQEVRRLVQKTAADEVTEIQAIIDQVLTDFGPGQMSELAALLAFLRASALVHQAHHWQTRGATAYGDHLLFERVYGDLSGPIDSVAERMIGSGHYILAQPILLARHCSLVVQSFYRDAGVNPPASAYPVLSLRVALRTLIAEKILYASLEQKGLLSHGIDNLLQDIADKLEGHVYLLKQRVAMKTARDQSVDPWKCDHARR